MKSIMSGMIRNNCCTSRIRRVRMSLQQTSSTVSQVWLCQMNLSSALEIFLAACLIVRPILNVKGSFPAAWLLCNPAGLRIKFRSLVKACHRPERKSLSPLTPGIIPRGDLSHGSLLASMKAVQFHWDGLLVELTSILALWSRIGADFPHQTAIHYAVREEGWLIQKHSVVQDNFLGKAGWWYSQYCWRMTLGMVEWWYSR